MLRPTPETSCLALALALSLASCSDEVAAPPPESAPPETATAPSAEQDPLAELDALWKGIAADREGASPEDADLAGALIQAHVLPEVENALWSVEPNILAITSDFHAELVSQGELLMKVEMMHRGELSETERNGYGDQSFQGYPCSRRNRFLFVLVGNIEIQAMGEDPAYRSVDALETLLARLPLERLAQF